MADYKGVLADLRGRIVALEKERAELDVAVSAIERIAQTSPDYRLTVKDVFHKEPTENSLVELTMPQAIAEYFRTAPGPRSIRQIMDGLTAGGFNRGSVKRGHVYNTLHRLSQPGGPYRHEENGSWTIVRPS